MEMLFGMSISITDFSYVGSPSHGLRSVYGTTPVLATRVFVPVVDLRSRIYLMLQNL
jgi:hypothetical protein